jgi:hypothetical protein
MRKLDKVRPLHENAEVLLFVDEGPVPGIHDDVQRANVRMTIEEALTLVDDLKKQIINALAKR